MLRSGIELPAATAIASARRLALDEGGEIDDGALALFESQYRALDESAGGGP